MPNRMSGGGDLTFVISADYAQRTGGWIYDHRLLQELAAGGWRIRTATLPAGFPAPSPVARAQSAATFAAIADDSLVLVDQLCLGVLPEVAAAEGDRLRLVMIVHHPLALEGYSAGASRTAFAPCGSGDRHLDNYGAGLARRLRRRGRSHRRRRARGRPAPPGAWLRRLGCEPHFGRRGGPAQEPWALASRARRPQTSALAAYACRQPCARPRPRRPIARH